MLKRGQLYHIDCLVSKHNIVEFIDGQRVAHARPFEDEVPIAGHLGFGVLGGELRTPALVQNLNITNLTE